MTIKFEKRDDHATGNRGGAFATGDEGAASATGDVGAASATGHHGAASATGAHGAAMASGRFGVAKGAEGCALFLTERDYKRNIVAVWSGIVGKDGIEPDTFYTLHDGQPVEIQDELEAHRSKEGTPHDN